MEGCKLCLQLYKYAIFPCNFCFDCLFFVINNNFIINP